MSDLTIPELTYMTYVGLSVGLTVWVGRTLHKNGRVFLVDAFKDETLADSVNHLLVVGFYLINLGFVALALKTGDVLQTGRQGIETLSEKVGAVSLTLGVLHLFNVYVFHRIRRRSRLHELAPPVQPDALLEPRPFEPLPTRA
jgi:hypothetical protein